ncbi:MAG: OB-fold nucleic acid binding domain-containing protein [Actinobacteria bacterium]|nr:OB-fold nucleic acid binding domain-containing protein [Actinomycetota bacterium]MBO0786888.1 OB-fold nucleic acid binding domain-containing protein [Actinomycetota bacterium]MBO0818721.1 OB-fold nucleic acid binding domain-containing protein [Actinomycetota bacterium]
MTTVTRGGGAGGRSRVRVTGSVQRVMPSRPGLPPVLQAELGSGPGRIRLVWLGRSRIPGIEPGRLLAVEGTLSLQRGRRTIYNPRYHLVPPAG